MTKLHKEVGAIDQFCLLQTIFKNSINSMYHDGSHASSEIIQHAIDGSIKLFDALVIRDILRDQKPKRILEVGTYLGFSLRWILECTKDFNADVVSLDPRVRHRIFDNIKHHVVNFTNEHASRLSFVDAFFSERNDTMFLHDYLKYEPKLTEQEALSFLSSIKTVSEPFDTFDFAFIDGDHEYNATILNVALAAKMMTNGGTIVVHDAISWPEVEPAVRDLVAKSNGIRLVNISGGSLHDWFQGRQLRKYIERDVGSAICDGLAILQIDKGLSVDQNKIEEILKNYKWRTSKRLSSEVRRRVRLLLASAMVH